MTSLRLISDLYNLAITIGVAYLIWSITTKYDLHYKAIYALKRWNLFKNTDLEICVLCLTFWMCYAISAIVGIVATGELGVEQFTYPVLRAIVSVPVVINLIKHQFED